MRIWGRFRPRPLLDDEQAHAVAEATLGRLARWRLRWALAVQRRRLLRSWRRQTPGEQAARSFPSAAPRAKKSRVEKSRKITPHLTARSVFTISTEMVNRILTDEEGLPFTRGDAAKAIGVAPETIDYYERIGRLLPATHTVGGIALFRRSDVLRVARDRARAREARGVAQRKKRSRSTQL